MPILKQCRKAVEEDRFTSLHNECCQKSDRDEMKPEIKASQEHVKEMMET
jgi:hypothetical protein